MDEVSRSNSMREDIPGRQGGTYAMKNANDRGAAKCSSCGKVFFKLELTTRGQCPACAKANRLFKRE